MEFSDNSLSIIVGISLSFILLDVFFKTDVLTVISLLGLSIYLVSFVSVPLEWQLTICLICWLSTSVLYVLLSKQIIPLLNKVFNLQNNSFHEMQNEVIGTTAVFRLIDGLPYAKWRDELMPVELSIHEDFNDNEQILISDYQKGVVKITKIK